MQMIYDYFRTREGRERGSIEKREEKYRDGHKLLLWDLDVLRDSLGQMLKSVTNGTWYITV